MKFNKAIFLYILLIFLTVVYGCGDTNKISKDIQSTYLIEKDCIKYIIAYDDSLGSVRNHACKTISLSETIRQYVESVNSLNINDCPLEFKLALENHMKAWQKMQKFTIQHSDLRGEMHELFDEIENGKDREIFKPILKDIWDTWAEVEAEVERAQK